MAAFPRADCGGDRPAYPSIPLADVYQVMDTVAAFSRIGTLLARA